MEIGVLQFVGSTTRPLMQERHVFLKCRNIVTSRNVLRLGDKSCDSQLSTHSSHRMVSSFYFVYFLREILSQEKKIHKIK